MTKKVSQEEIDMQLGESSPTLEFEHIEAPANIPSRPEFIDERVHPHERFPFNGRRRQSDDASKTMTYDFNFIWKSFLVILCLKSWWILLMWGSSFFFKDWPFLGFFRIQPYLVPNLLVGSYFAWKRALMFPTFQCLVSLFFAVSGLNPLLSEHLGVSGAILCNIAIAVGLRFYLPRCFPKLNFD